MESMMPSVQLPTLSTPAPSAEIYKEKRYILQHVLRSTPLLSSARQALEKMDYFSGYPDLKAIVEFSTEYFDTMGTVPKKVTLDENMDNILSPNIFQENVRTAARAWLNHAYRSPEQDMDYGFIERIVQEDYGEYIREDYRKKVANAGSDELQTLSEEFSKDMNDPLFGKRFSRQCMFDDLEENLKIAIRQPTGVPFLDELMNGGTIEGELIGVLAPSGGGKSTVANMLLAACVARKKDCWYYSTEQSLKGDMAVRHACLALNTSRDKFKEGYVGLEPSLKETLDSLRSLWQTYCGFVDISHEQDIKCVDDLMYQVEEKCKLEGERPGMIIIDWWGRLSDTMSLNKGLTGEAKRQYDRDQLHNMKKWADKLETPVVIFHQLSGAANQKGPSARLTAADAQENKAFNNMFDFCVVLGNRDGDDILNASTDKARGEARQDIKVKLNGAFCKMDIADEPDDVSFSDLTTDMSDMDMDFGFDDTSSYDDDEGDYG